MSESAAVSRDWWLALARPRTWLLVLAGYLLLHMGMRLLLSDTLQLDDAEQLVQSQAWQLAYGNFQPPFYTWVLWALWHVLDPSLWVLYVIRYLIIGLSFWLWHRVSLLLFDDPRWQVASATSWLLIAQFGWKLHQGSTHTTLLTLALVMSLHAVVLVLRKPTLRHYLYLGLAVGLGMMAKYSYAGFLLPMLLAALAAPDTRARLLRWPMLFALGAAALVMLPGLLSLFSADAPVANRLQGETHYHLGGLLAGDVSVPWEFLKGALGFLAPLWLIYAAIFRIPLHRSRPHTSAHIGKGARGSEDSGLPPSMLPSFQERADGMVATSKLLDRFHLAVLVCVLGTALFVGIDHLKPRWLHPFLTLAPFWWLLRAANHPLRRHAWAALKWATVALTVLVVVARLWQLFATPYVGKPSRVTWPVMPALEQVPADILGSPSLKLADQFLGAHIILRTGRKVDVIHPEGAVAPGALVLRGVTSVAESAKDEASDTRRKSGYGFRATRGNVQYTIVCRAGEQRFVREGCQSSSRR